MWFRLFPLLSLLLLPQAVLAQDPETPQPEVAPENCPVTRPYQTSRFVPPAPYWTKEDTGRFWFGTDRLWTLLPIDGVWERSNKLFWWRQGYDAYREPRPKLIITGKRLDSLAPNLKADRATNAFAPPRSAMLIGVELPTTGCWQITGRYEDDELTFVAWVRERKWTESDRQGLLAKAQDGDVGAQFWLGAGYEQGWFGNPDLQEALKWFRSASAHGDPDAQNALGGMYENGEGVKQDYLRAAYWYRKAAEHIPDRGGAGQGRNNLGRLYMDGLGVPQDNVQAYMWFSLTNSQTNLTEAKARMSSAQVLEAERMAEEWKRHHPEQ